MGEYTAREAARDRATGRFGEQHKTDPGGAALPADPMRQLAEQCRQAEETLNEIAREAHRRYIDACSSAARFSIVNILALNDVPRDATVTVDQSDIHDSMATLGPVIHADGDYQDLGAGWWDKPRVEATIDGQDLLEGFAGATQPSGVREIDAGHAYAWAETELAELGGAA